MAVTGAPQGAVKPLPGLTSWAGGKRHLARRLGALIDADRHRTYVEPFAGAGHVFFGRALRRPAEILNDANAELVNLYRCWRRHPDELLRTILATPFARVEFDRLVRVDVSTLTEIERAARLLFLQSARFGGRLDRFSFCAAPESVKARTADRWSTRIAQAAARLSSVVIEHKDFEAILDRYDTPKTLFYLDPPYWGAEDAYGRGCFGPADFDRLRAALDRLKGRFMMSLNDTPEVRALFGHFQVRSIETVWSTMKPGGQRVTELLISGV